MMKRSDLVSNKNMPATPGGPKSEAWSKIANEIVENLSSQPRFVRVEKAGPDAIRLLIGAVFYDAQINGVSEQPRPQVAFNVMCHMIEFGKIVRLKIYTMDTGLAYEFTYKAGKLTRKLAR
jgi:hypothetical protein